MLLDMNHILKLRYHYLLAYDFIENVMIGAPGMKMSGIFYGCVDVEYVYVYELSQERLRALTRAFTNPDGGIWNNHLICFTPLHSNVSSWDSRCIKYYVQESLTWIFGLNRSNTTRTRLETQTNMYVQITNPIWNIWNNH